MSPENFIEEPVGPELVKIDVDKPPLVEELPGLLEQEYRPDNWADFDASQFKRNSELLD